MFMKNTIGKLNKEFIQKKGNPISAYQDCLKQIDKIEDKINAFITVSSQEGFEAAVKSKQRFDEGKSLSDLDGITVGIKDVFDTKGIETTAASKMLDGFVPPFDATVVSKLKEAGAVIIGKNNCDAWAHGASTEHSDFGVTKNPWDLKRVPGGSSGGSAAAVAASECIYSIGSDTGGSIRQPAAFCGVVGLKPTYGRVSRFGLIAMGSSLDCVGPITNTVMEAAKVMEVIAGYDPKDATSQDLPVPKYSQTLGRPIRGMKIGWVEELFELGLDKEIKEKLIAARKIYEELGVEFVDVKMPYIKYGIPVYYTIQTAEVSSNLGRYDGIKYGFSAENSTSLVDHYFKSRDEGLGDEAKRRIMLGTFVLSSGYYDAYYEKAMKVRTLIRADFDQVMNQVDVILAPVTPTTAFKIGEKSEDPLQMYLADIYTASVNLSGNPAISLPCGFSQAGLPIGMQIIGKFFDEQNVMNFGYMYEEATVNEAWRKAEPKI